MQFLIRMGIPEIEELWSKLQSEYRSGAISKKDTSLYKKWGKALKLLSDNPRHPGLLTFACTLHRGAASSPRFLWQKQHPSRFAAKTRDRSLQSTGVQKARQ